MISKQQKNGIKSFNIILSLSFILRIIFMYWDRYCRHIFTFPNSGLDTGSFDSWAKDFIANGMSGQSGYPTVLGWIYKLFYPNPLWGQYINVLASVLTILVVYKILCKLKINQKYKMYGVLLICFMPNYLIMSSILLRESLITLLLAVALYFLINWWYINKWRNVFISILFVLAAAYLHSGTIVYAVAIFLVIAFAGNKQRIFKFKLSTIILGLVSTTFFMFIYNNYGDVFFGYMGGLNSVEEVVQKSETYATGGSAYGVSIIDDSSLLGLIVNSPLRMFYFLASPLPWEWRGVNDIIAFLGNGSFYMISIYYGFKAISNRNCDNKNLIIIMLIFALGSAFLYSWGVSNAGTALRHRDKFITNFALLLVISLDAIYKSNKLRNINRGFGRL